MPFRPLLVRLGAVILAWLLFLPVAAEAQPRVGPVTLRIIDIYGDEELDRERGLVSFAHRAMNAVHPGTRRYVVRRELLFREGDPLDPALLEETARNLRSLGFLTNVTITPTDTLPGGIVPVEVSVQETWSLRTSLSYSRASESDRWNVLVSDSNFLGHGLQLEAGMGEDEDRSWTQFRYESRRLLGSDARLRLKYFDLSDGRTRELGLDRPYYAENDRWGGSISAWDRIYRPRYHLGGVADAPPDLRATPRLFREGLLAQGSLRVSADGAQRLWRLGLGVRVENFDFRFDDLVELSDGRFLDRDDVLGLAGHPLLRESGRTVQAYLTVSSVGRRWATSRFVRRYGAVEDVPLDLQVSLTAGPAPGFLGTDRSRWIMDWKLVDWSRAGPGWWLSWCAGRAGFGDGTWYQASVLQGWTGRQLGGVTKVFVEGATAKDPLGTEVLALGLTRGLRTSDYSGMVGDRLLRWTAEHSLLLPDELLGFYRLGVAGFYAGGNAWWHDGDRDLGDARHEAGVGLRFGPTRSAKAEVSRLDLVWPLNGGGGMKVTAATGGYF